MQQKTDKNAAQRAEALEQLEKVKEQYRQYLEISQIYSLPVFQPEPEPEYAPPTPENPLAGGSIALGKI